MSEASNRRAVFSAKEPSEAVSFSINHCEPLNPAAPAVGVGVPPRLSAGVVVPCCPWPLSIARRYGKEQVSTLTFGERSFVRVNEYVVGSKASHYSAVFLGRKYQEHCSDSCQYGLSVLWKSRQRCHVECYSSERIIIIQAVRGKLFKMQLFLICPAAYTKIDNWSGMREMLVAKAGQM